jgi:hypothetical protein
MTDIIEEPSGPTGLKAWTDDEMRAWDAFHAGRKAAGATIDINTCKFGRDYVDTANPYSFGERYCGQTSKLLFVWSPDSGGPVLEEDLPGEKRAALHARIASERAKRAHGAPAAKQRAAFDKVPEIKTPPV